MGSEMCIRDSLQLAPFNLLNQAGTGILIDLNALCEAVHQGMVHLTGKGCGSSQHAHSPGLTLCGSRLDRRFHTHKGDFRVTRTQIMQRHCEITDPTPQFSAEEREEIISSGCLLFVAGLKEVLPDHLPEAEVELILTTTT